MTSNLPAHLQALMGTGAMSIGSDAAGGIQPALPPHLSIRDNRFTLVDGAGNQLPIQTLYLDVVVVSANPVLSKMMFDPSKPYDADAAEPPLCFSDNGIGASSQARYPQSATCATCPNNKWGSAISKMTGEPIKACADRKKLAFIVPNDASGLCFQLNVPPATLRNLGQYANTLKGHGVDLPVVVTRLEFASQGVLKFSPSPTGENGTPYIDAATAQRVKQVWDSHAADAIVGKLDTPVDPARLAAPAAPQGQLPPPPAPQNFQAPQQLAAQAPAGQFAAPAPAGQFGAPTYAGPTPQPQGAGFGQPPAPGPAKRGRRARGSAEAPPAAPQLQPQGAQQFTQQAPAAQFGQPVQQPPQQFAAPAQADAGIPQFLNRQQPQPGANLGLQTAPAPNADVMAKLNAAFALPTG